MVADGHTWEVLEDEQAMAARLAELMLEEARGRKGDVFNVALSGGSLVKLVAAAALAERAREGELSAWQVFLADERVVPVEDPESTYGQYQRALGPPFYAALRAFERPVAAGESCHDADRAAREYEALLRSCHAGHGLDMAILGVGPDGHTASLFPPLKPSQLNGTDHMVEAVHDSPKPPRDRITLTLSYLQKTRKILYVAAGETKARVIAEIISGESGNGDANWSSPCAWLPGHWLLDSSAAAALQ